jgi:hypothetical protein
MARKKARHLMADERQPALAPGPAPALTTPPSSLQLLHASLGNRALQRLLETPQAAQPQRIQRGLMDSLWDMMSGAASAIGEAASSAAKASAPAASGAGETATVTDADARLRTDPPDLKNTGAKFSKGARVQISNTTTKDGLKYVLVQQVMDEGVFGPPLSGWTRRSNLDLRGASADIAPEKPETVTPAATDPTHIPGVDETPNIDHPNFLRIVDLLEAMEASPVPIEKTHKEEVGDARRQRVTQIAEVRALIAELRPETLGVGEGVLKSAIANLYRRLAPLAPYYNQIANTNMLTKSDTKGWMRTCNITVPAMVVEGLGKSRDDYDGRWGDIALLQQVFDALEGKYLARAQYEAAADFEALRLPDFMSLVGIARKLPKGAADLDADKFDAAVSKAREKAAAATTAHSTITDVLTAFGTTPVQGWISTAKLEKIGTARRDYTRVLLGANNKDREAKKAKYDALDADAILTVKAYRQSVLKQINPLLDAGAQILVGMENHFVRLDAMDEDTVQIDDPGYGSLKNARLTWQQARDFGMFKSYWSVTE